LTLAWQLYSKVFVPSPPASFSELFANSGPLLFLANFIALALWRLVSALRPVWAEYHCVRFVPLCALITLIFGQLQEGGFVYVGF